MMNNLFRAFLLYPLLGTTILLTGCAFIPSPICDRTEQVRQAILEQIPGLNFCWTVTPVHLESVTILNLSGQSIAELQATDFRGLSNLSELGLYDNQLTTLPEGIFAGLSNLPS